MSSTVRLMTASLSCREGLAVVVPAWLRSWRRVLACQSWVTVAVSPRLSYFLGSPTTFRAGSKRF